MSPTEDGPEFRFIPVRHPLDRLVSVWAFFTVPGNEGHALIEHSHIGLRKLGYRERMGFGAFLDIALAQHDANVHTKKQSIHAGPHADGAYLCRLDGLANAWVWLQCRFPYLGALEWRHRTKRDGWEGMYSPDQRRSAEAVFADDLALFERASNGDEPNG